MAQEIERKFLVKNQSFIKESFKQKQIKQGFLNSHKNRTVRIRIQDNKSFITIKGLSNEKGTTRYEWEKEISVKEGKELLALCEESIIEKTRYLVKSGEHIFEVDVFSGDNKGLIVAEVELERENEEFTIPTWIQEEVTGQKKYYNSLLSKTPFKDW
ncbi:MAG: CYTH domain-containing protein [Flavicella sp.]